METLKVSRNDLNATITEELKAIAHIWLLLHARSQVLAHGKSALLRTRAAALAYACALPIICVNI